jgi:hypothetical protein
VTTRRARASRSRFETRAGSGAAPLTAAVAVAGAPEDGAGATLVLQALLRRPPLHRLAPVLGPPAWQLVKQLVEGSGTYSNVDIGGVGAADQESLHVAIKGLFPSSSGNMHIKTSLNWDLGTAIRFTNSELGYKGLYSIEVNTQGIREVYETILANI